MPPSAATAAIKLLSRREHTRKELAEKLHRRGFHGEEINDALRQLEEKALLSDLRFSLAYIREKQRQFGDWRLRLELSHRGVSEEDIDRALRQETRQEESERAAAVFAAKYPAGCAADKTAQAMRFLRQRGFCASAVMSAMSRTADK